MARRRLWEISPAYLCPLVGTCLPMPALRRLARRAGVEGASGMSDYELHHAAVHLAAERNAFSRLAHKELDMRFAPALNGFAQASEEAVLAKLWTRALENGDIAGALWALMTHPAASASLLQLASQDVHMLSHQVGASSRADLARLAALENDNRVLRERLDDYQCTATRQLALKEEQIVCLERRAAEAGGIALRLREVEEELRRVRPAPATQRDEALIKRLTESEARCARLAGEVAEARRERDAAEAALHTWLTALPQPPEHTALELCGHRVLYVGGRTGLVERYRLLVKRHGGELLHHDGGLEESLKRLHPLLAAADMVVCAAGETSHAAYYIVKRFCKQAGKPCALLRRSSLASLLNALRALAGEANCISAGDRLLLPAA
jgi:Uncharacterized protein conserved in bacteria (DUF2325)